MKKIEFNFTGKEYGFSIHVSLPIADDIMGEVVNVVKEIEGVESVLLRKGRVIKVEASRLSGSADLVNNVMSAIKDLKGTSPPP